MKHVDEASLRDIKASIALGIAEILPPDERVAAVVGTLHVDETEARLLISRGRRIAREKRLAPARGAA